jgi:hypothetical protein
MKRPIIAGMVLATTLLLGLALGSVARASFGWLRLSAPCANVNALAVSGGRIFAHCAGDATIYYTDTP